LSSGFSFVYESESTQEAIAEGRSGARSHEAVITEKASITGYTGLVPARWAEVSDLTVANLYWYLQAKVG